MSAPERDTPLLLVLRGAVLCGWIAAFAATTAHWCGAAATLFGVPAALAFARQPALQARPVWQPALVALLAFALAAFTDLVPGTVLGWITAAFGLVPALLALSTAKWALAIFGGLAFLEVTGRRLRAEGLARAALCAALAAQLFAEHRGQYLDRPGWFALWSLAHGLTFREGLALAGVGLFASLGVLLMQPQTAGRALISLFLLALIASAAYFEFLRDDALLAPQRPPTPTPAPRTSPARTSQELAQVPPPVPTPTPTATPTPTPDATPTPTPTPDVTPTPTPDVTPTPTPTPEPPKEDEGPALSFAYWELAEHPEPVALCELPPDFSSDAYAYFRCAVYGRLRRNRLVGTTDGSFDTDVPVGPVRESRRFDDGARAPELHRIARGRVLLIARDERVPSPALGLRFELASRVDADRFANAYDATFRLPDARPDLLRDRAAGDPAWDSRTRERYLACPTDGRYWLLARELLGPQGAALKPFQKALALRDGLQARCMFANVRELTDGENPVAEFLFPPGGAEATGRRGHGAHLAHALCFLARASGIPARVAEGYRVAASSSVGGAWLPRRSDRHAWAEVYLEGAGWYGVDVLATTLSPPIEPAPSSLVAEWRERANQPPPAWLRWRKELAAVPATRWLSLALIGLWLALLVAKFAQRARARLPAAFQRGRQPAWTFRACLSLLADAGLRRRRGESWEEMANRLEPSIPELRIVVLAYLRTLLVGPGGLTSGQWADLRERVAKRVRRSTPLSRRLIGLVDPFTWLRVGAPARDKER